MNPTLQERCEMNYLKRETKNYWLMKKKPEWWLASNKLDGLFGHMETGTGIVSREGHPFSGFAHIEEEIRQLMAQDERITHVQGELYSPSFAFQELQGIVRGSDPTHKKQMRFHIFEIGGYELTDIENIGKFKYLVPVHFWYISNDEVECQLETAISRGHEGLVLRNMDKRDTFYKVKGFKECDVVITGYKEGQGHITGMLGSFHCSGKVGNQLIEVTVGTGYKKSGTPDSRTELWKIRDEMIGRTIEVRYDVMSLPNKNGIASLLKPRFNKRKDDR